MARNACIEQFSRISLPHQIQQIRRVAGNVAGSERSSTGASNATNVPPELAAALSELAENTPHPTPIDDTQFAALLEAAISMLQIYDLVFTNPYHNNISHSLNVIGLIEAMLSEYRYPLEVQQALILAALGHDLAHPGGRSSTLLEWWEGKRTDSLHTPRKPDGRCRPSGLR